MWVVEAERILATEGRWALGFELVDYVFVCAYGPMRYTRALADGGDSWYHSTRWEIYRWLFVDGDGGLGEWPALSEIVSLWGRLYAEDIACEAQEETRP